MESKKEEDILFLIKKLDKHLGKDFNARLSEQGLTCQQGRILLYINKMSNEGECVHQNDIENHFQLSKSTVSGLVSRLEKNGFIEKKLICKSAYLTPSEKGQSLYKFLNKHRNQLINKLLSNFSESEKQAMILTLNKLLTNLKENEYVAKN